ncbi:hypothetical protein KO164_0004 [Thalassospira sp. KO164]|nr:hypothetical protein KO164_0004 [Thalassospira sp. KO164]SEC84748.1 hypothetical protein SAMN04515623_0004 [Thalassospira permensis]
MSVCRLDIITSPDWAGQSDRYVIFGMFVTVINLAHTRNGSRIARSGLIGDIATNDGRSGNFKVAANFHVSGEFNIRTIDQHSCRNQHIKKSAHQ